MKKRIIAALTALVMVVTMIPANAFAADPVTDVIKAIYQATNSDTADGAITVKYDQKTVENLDDALAKYNALTVPNKEKVTNITNLYAAMYAVKIYCDRIDAYKSAVNGLVGKVDETGGAALVTGIKAALTKLAETTVAENDRPYISKDENGNVEISADSKDGYTKYAGAITVEDIKTPYDKAADKGHAPLVLDDKTVTTPQFAKILKKDGKFYNVDRAKEDAMVKTVIGDIYGADATNITTVAEIFKTALASINNVTADDIAGLDKDNVLPAGNIEAALKAVYGDDMIPGGKDGNKDATFADGTPIDSMIPVLATAELAEKFNKIVNTVVPTLKVKVEIDEALNSIIKPLNKDGEPDANLDYTAGVRDGKAANTNAVNLAAVKKVYENAVAVYDKYKAEPAYKTYMEDMDGLKSKIDALYDKENESGVFVTVEKAIEYKNIIEKLEAKIGNKETLTIADKMEYNKIVQTEESFLHLDCYLTDIDAVAASGEIKKICTEIVAPAMAGISVEPKEVAKSYVGKVKAVLEAIPTHDTVLEDLEGATTKVKEAIKVLNEYIAAMKAAGAEDADLLNLGDSIDDIEAAAGMTELGDKYLINENIKESLIKNFKLASGVIHGNSTNIEQDPTYTDALGKLTTVVGSNEVRTHIECDNLEKSIKDYDDAYEKMDATVKAYFDKNKALADKFAKLAKLRNSVVRYRSIEDSIKIIEKMIDDNFKDLAIKSDKTEINYGNNKIRLDAIDKVLEDENVKYTFENLKKFPKDVITIWHEFDSTDPEYVSEIARYNTAKAEYNMYISGISAKDVVAKIDALVDLKDDAKYADIDSAIAAYNVAKDAYDALSNVDKAYVSNSAKLVSYEKSIKDALVRELEKEIKALGTVEADGELTTTQVTKTKNLLDNLAKYEKVLGTEIYNKKGTTAGTMFPGISNTAPYELQNAAFNAIQLLDKSEIKLAIKEIEAAYEIIVDGCKVVNEDNKTIDTYAEAALVLKAIDAYNGLSDLAKDILTGEKANNVDLPEGIVVIDQHKLDNLVAGEKIAKSFFLANATISAIDDQVVTGEYIEPTVEVKDALGNVISADEYVVEYFNNLNVGEAKVVVTAKTESKYLGSVEAKFNIVAEDVAEPVVPTGLKVIGSDNGILKIGVDKVDVAGLTYKFFIKKVGNENWVASKETTSNEVVFRGLTKNAKYEVKAVTIVNDKVSDEAVMEGTVWTNRIGTRSAFMYKPVIKKVTINKGVAKVTVKEFDYNNIKYAVGFKRANASKYTWLQYTAKTVKTVKNLKKGVKYSFKVKYNYTSEVSGTTVVSTKWSNAVTKVAK